MDKCVRGFAFTYSHDKRNEFEYESIFEGYNHSCYFYLFYQFNNPWYQISSTLKFTHKIVQVENLCLGRLENQTLFLSLDCAMNVHSLDEQL